MGKCDLCGSPAGNYRLCKRCRAGKKDYDKTHREPKYEDTLEGRGAFELEVDHDTIRAAKGFKGVVKKPTAFLVGEDGHERVEITPIKKFTPKTKTPKFNTGKSNYPKLNLQRDSFTPKKSKVNIVKKLPRTNLQYPKMTDIFDMPSSIKMPKSGSMKMPRGNPYSMDMPKGDNMFGTMERSAKSKGSIFPDMGDVFNMKDVFDMPKVNSKGFNMGVEKNIFGIGDTDFDSPSRKAKKFYGKVKEKKLDNLGGFRDWGKLDDKVSDYDFKY